MLNEATESYLRSIRSYKRISRKREEELSAIIQDNKDEAKVEASKEELITSNLFLVVKCAYDFLKRYHGSLSLMDLIAEGNMGLVKAANSYDGRHKSNASFGSYAYRVISRNIDKAIVASAVVRVPDYFPHFRYKVKLLEEKGVSDEDILKELGISERLLICLRQGIINFSLEEVNNEGLRWEDKLIDDSESNESTDHMLQALLQRYMDDFQDIEKAVIYDIYYGEKTPTYDQMSKKHHLSGERLRQIHLKCLRKMKSKIISDLNFGNKSIPNMTPKMISALKYGSRNGIILTPLDLEILQERADVIAKIEHSLLSQLVTRNVGSSSCI